MEVRPVHAQKAPFPISVSLSPNSTEVSAAQSEKAYSSMMVTLGMDTEVRSMQ